MKSNLLLIVFLAFVLNISAQVTYKEDILPPLPKANTINLSEPFTDYEPNWQVLEAPPVDGDSYAAYLAKVKEESAKKFPKNYDYIPQARSGSEAPVVTRALFGNPSPSNTPTDNHIAVNANEQVISVVNSNITVKDAPNFITSLSISLEAFTETLAISNFVFDPRVNYDPKSDRYFMTMLSGSRSNESYIILAFSETNDASGNWHQYVLDGTPEDDGTWSDYPMITFTDTEFFLSMNSIRDNEPWETGFDHTLIYQWKKEEAFNGDPLNMKVWYEVEYGGKSIRNIHPVKDAKGEPGDNVYFLSNRNFDMQNDSIFILEITGKHDDPNTALEVDVKKMDQPYGAPPHATQREGLLQTNDARILDSYLLNDKVHFVGNTINFDNGLATFYHGIVDDIAGERSISSNFIQSVAGEEYGYPSIAYTGIEQEDTDAIIVFLHTSANRNAGYSALYYDNDGLYSPHATVKEGITFIDMLNQEVERWGDYSGNQRNYSDPGEVWVSASYGGTQRVNGTTIGEIIRPSLFVSTDQIAESVKVKTYPNPTTDRFSIEIDAMDIDNLHMFLTDLNGKVIHTFTNTKPKRSGILDFSFSTQPLSAGTYLLNIVIDDQERRSEKVVVTK